MSLIAWNEDIPSDNNLAGEGDDEIVSLKARVKERLELDHHFSGELDPLEGDCDGYHKKVTLQKLSADPTPLTGTGVLYTKEVDGIIELFFVDAVSGVVNQLTEQGVLSLNTLQNDIDGNEKNITGLGALSITGDITVGGVVIGKPVTKLWSSTLVTSSSNGLGGKTMTVKTPIFVVLETSPDGTSWTFSQSAWLPVSTAGVSYARNYFNSNYMFVSVNGIQVMRFSNPNVDTRTRLRIVASEGVDSSTLSDVVTVA